MKLFNKTITLLIIAVVITACYKDSGNYDYDYMNEVKVSGFEEANLSFKYGSEVTIEPTVVTEMPQSDLSYMWLLTSNGQPYDTLGYEKNLNTTANFTSGNLTFRVIHEPSGRHYSFGNTIMVMLPFEKGWGILNEVSGVAHFNFLSGVETDNEGNVLWEYFPAMYESSNGEALPANSNRLLFGYEDEQWVVANETDGVIFDFLSMAKTRTLRECFPSMDYMRTPFKPEFIKFGDPTSKEGTRLITSGGDLFAAVFVDDGATFNFYAPILGDHYIKDKISRVGDHHYLFFDEQSKGYKFVNLRQAKAESKPAIKASGIPEADGIDVTDLNMDCLFLSYAGISWDKPIIYSILKNDAGEYYLHMMDDNFDSGFFDPNPYDLRFNHVQKIDAELINENTQIIIPPGSKNIFFATDNKIHVFIGQNKVFYKDWFVGDKNLDAFFIDKEVFAYGYSNGESSMIEIREFPKQTLINSLEVGGNVLGLTRINQ